MPGVPLIHTNQTGVIVLEPISDLTQKHMLQVRSVDFSDCLRLRLTFYHALQIEQEKLATAHSAGAANAAALAAAAAAVAAAGVGSLDATDGSNPSGMDLDGIQPAGDAAPAIRKRKVTRQPNPLSVKKTKKAVAPSSKPDVKRKREREDRSGGGAAQSEGPKHKRRKRGKGFAAAAASAGSENAVEAA